ncbi:MAG: hypothetical protein KGH97_03860, partial [Patescibacteria group bacterium]|nr:hypothetical protein [Patescibacteria group bacterium]
MNRAPLAALLLALLIAPASFLALPSRAHAIPVTEVGPNLVENTITAVKQTLSTALDVTNTAANVARQIKAYVLDPLAFVMSGNLLKTITSSMLGFVGGQNSSGRPLYISNLRNYLQNVGDVEAYSFLNQFQSQSNSPFAAAITSSLRANYLQSTSAAGFFAANQSTLGNYSSNPNGFVSGNWGLGGWAAWMGLTTAPQNDPYTDYFIAQNQLYNQVGTAQSTKLAQANWGQGFLASCGS